MINNYQVEFRKMLQTDYNMHMHINTFIRTPKEHQLAKTTRSVQKQIIVLSNTSSLIQYIYHLGTPEKKFPYSF